MSWIRFRIQQLSIENLTTNIGKGSFLNYVELTISSKIFGYDYTTAL